MRKPSKMVERTELVAAQKQSNRLDIALHATMNDLVEWGDWIREVRGNGRYHVGITLAWMDGCNLAIPLRWITARIRFRCSITNPGSHRFAICAHVVSMSRCSRQ